MKRFLNNLSKCNIVPTVTTEITHRLEDCLPFYGATWSEDHNGYSLAGAYLPLFTAPMACVVNDKNYLTFDQNNVIPIIPRTVPFETRMELAKQSVWIAVGLDEFEKIINTEVSFATDTYICVDIANGHMKKLLGLCKEAKLKFDNLTLMAGNIANPSTYEEYAKVGVDYIRIGIGFGSACSTNDLTGIGYNPYTFLSDLKWRKERVSTDYKRLTSRFKSVPYIVYDGGCESIRDIIVALALGADYVMCGKMFAQTNEACGKIIPKKVTRTVEKHCKKFIDPELELIEDDVQPFEYIEDVTETVFVNGRMYYGMSTERAQREMGNTKIKYSEGKEYWVPILYTLKDWVSQFIAAITSSMSYCNAKTLQAFIGVPEVRLDY